MLYPVATYRVQFHRDFTLKDFQKIIPYLKTLGISTVYASPIFAAVPGSTHGYDVTDPLLINPEIGTLDELRAIKTQLKELEINWLQDIVPNHMAFHPSNHWMVDVLEKGSESDFASFFDIDWNTNVEGGKLMVPFLGSDVETVVGKKELQLVLHEKKPMFRYFESYYPINAESAALVQQLDEQPDTAVMLANQNEAFLLNLVELQHYRLCHWQETDQRINFRRFFTINGLISLNIDLPQVFKKYHEFIKQLIDEGIIDGLRIDHIDGLYAPTSYLRQLKELVGWDKYVVVEKILQQGEVLPEYWNCEGTTGYEFLALVNNLFTNRNAQSDFEKFYQQLTGNHTPVAEQIREKKSYILQNHMRGELDNLYHLLTGLLPADKGGITDIVWKETIAAFLVECPVYRFYPESLPLKGGERVAVSDILQAIEKKRPELTPALQSLRNIFFEVEDSSTADLEKHSHFFSRCMQFSGPLTAKGVEDTLMYTYNCFIGHNDVGDAPEAFGMASEAIHAKMLARQKHWNLSINTTSTHDTKRGEDVRARLNVLTDVKDEWLQAVKEWQQLNTGLKKNAAPDANDEYFIYQTLIGALPMDGVPDATFSDRMDEYLQKSLREAKIHSNWTNPNEPYETAAKEFTRTLLRTDTKFWKSFSAFHRRIVDAGIVNSLSQLLLKCTSPGVPDIYQGAELWDLSLVDPDNRRPVNYDHRAEIIDQLESKTPTFNSELWESRTDGRIKLWLTQKLLKTRNEYKELFADGHYIPLKVEGRYRENVFAFARRMGDTWIVVAVPLHTAQLAAKQKKGVNAIDWRTTRIILRPEMPVAYEEVFTGEKGKAGGEIFLKDIFKTLPLAMLYLKQPKNDRGAGILLAVSSLPSAFGIGDMGPEAKQFAKILSRSQQKYWQLLPLNPTEFASGHSPYSSYASMAGNPLLISPELLVTDGLLEQEISDRYKIACEDKSDYSRAEQIRKELFDLAYENFCDEQHAEMAHEFEAFCAVEAYWLDDMAMYCVLKEDQEGKPWHEWPEPFRLRQAAALEQIFAEKKQEIRKVKWLQFIFSKQWKALRQYCNSLGIQLFGDMPFYVSYDSVDVWANPDLFCLDASGKMTGVAGVPPDYFSATGQLWGMPTFNWNKLKEQNYDWWVMRLKRNLEFFDLLRIDHFRALQDFWQVPAGETTAMNGEWMPGPRKEFFDMVRERLGSLPFIAEDLGDKMEAVYDLRDEVGLPGMKVLQFAWGEQMPESVDIPHNHQVNSVVYTGTHDNNTTIGWYKEETNKADHQRMHHYLALKVKQQNIHQILARVAYASVGKIAMLPMQDVLGLDATTRMNTPGRAEGNWLWRLRPDEIVTETEMMVRDWVRTFHR